MPYLQRGDTPLHNASRWSAASVVEILLDYGASTAVVNKQNKTPFHLAKDEVQPCVCFYSFMSLTIFD
jgi:ankyrin repeat protein